MALMGWGDGGLADVYPPGVVLIASVLAFVVAIAAIGARSGELRRLFGRSGWSLAPEALSSL